MENRLIDHSFLVQKACKKDNAKQLTQRAVYDGCVENKSRVLFLKRAFVRNAILQDSTVVEETSKSAQSHKKQKCMSPFSGEEGSKNTISIIQKRNNTPLRKTEVSFTILPHRKTATSMMIPKNKTQTSLIQLTGQTETHQNKNAHPLSKEEVLKVIEQALLIIEGDFLSILSEEPKQSHNRRPSTQ